MLAASPPTPFYILPDGIRPCEPTQEVKQSRIFVGAGFEPTEEVKQSRIFVGAWIRTDGGGEAISYSLVLNISIKINILFKYYIDWTIINSFSWFLC